MHLFFFVLIVLNCLSAQAAKFSCPVPFANETVQMSHLTPKGIELVVCGHPLPESLTIGKPLGLHSFGIYATNVHAKNQAVWVEDDEARTYEFQKFKGAGLEVRETLYLNGETLPYLVRTVTCNAYKCQRGALRCAFKSRPRAYPRALKEFRSYVADEDDAGDKGADLQLQKLLVKALSGDKEALAVFGDEKIRERLSGAAEDFFVSAQSILTRAREGHCIK